MDDLLILPEYQGPGHTRDLRGPYRGLYKVLKRDTNWPHQTNFQHMDYSEYLPKKISGRSAWKPGPWTDAVEVARVPCVSGYHATNIEHLYTWGGGIQYEVYLADLTGDLGQSANKCWGAQIRLLARLPWTHTVARRWIGSVLGSLEQRAGQPLAHPQFWTGWMLALAAGRKVGRIPEPETGEFSESWSWARNDQFYPGGTRRLFDLGKSSLEYTHAQLLPILIRNILRYTKPLEDLNEIKGLLAQACRSWDLMHTQLEGYELLKFDQDRSAYYHQAIWARLENILLDGPDLHQTEGFA